MNKIETFNKNSRIIGKDREVLLVTNHPTATLRDGFQYAAAVDINGKHLTEQLPIDYFTRDEEAEWEEVNGYYSDYVKETKENLTKNSLMGLAVGDALGVPFEFMSREEVKQHYIPEMIGCENNLNFESRWGKIIPSGSWSDDTSMTIAAMDTIEKLKGNINYNSIMNSFIYWWYKGYYTSLNQPFGLGNVVSDSLGRYRNGVSALDCGGTDIKDNGNGALMRILPFSIYSIKTEMPEEETVDFISKASAITHGHDISKMSCFIYTEFLRKLVETKNPRLAYMHITGIEYRKYFSEEAIIAHKQIINSTLIYAGEEKLVEKNGYVVATLESSLNSILKTENFEDALSKAIKLGYDTDTIGAVTGGLAGALYGYDAIPQRWLSKLRKKHGLEQIADKYEKVMDKLEKKNKNKELK